MDNFLTKLIFPRSFPLNKINIDKNRLLGNYKYLSSLDKNITIAPVLKSNAYGHGIELVGKLIDEVEAPFVCVDSLYEAYQLKKAKIKTPVLIMGYVDPRSLRRRHLPFSYAIYDLSYARALNDYQKGSEVHIFVDTGMHREGVKLEDLAGFINSLKKFKSLKIVGLMTHLAKGGSPKDSLTLRQFREFKEAIKICENAGLNLEWTHMGGSNAILHNDLKDSGVNLVRAGLALYGIDPIFKEVKNLKPVLAVTTKLVEIKEIGPSETVGYDGSYTAQKPMKIGILPFGYNDGVDRRLSNRGCVLIKGKVCKILGLLSMNMTTIDLTGIEKPFIGEEVVVFSKNIQDPNSIVNTSKTCQTTPYVILIHLNPTTKRIAS
jgi:alanine racemase